MVRAAVLEQGGVSLEVVDDLEVADPAVGEVRVRVRHAGLRGSDLHYLDASDGQMPLPVVLGHEVGGVVDAVGPGVDRLAPGDHVLLTALPGCVVCPPCVRGRTVQCRNIVEPLAPRRPDGTTGFARRGRVVERGYGLGGFSELTLVRERSAIKVPDDVPLHVAAVTACAVTTGVGSVINTARVEAGETVLVLGLGGVGLSVVQGARVAGASQIIASDPVEERRMAAAKFGATEVIDPTTTDVVEAVMGTTKGVGVDYAFDSVGSVSLLEQAMRATATGGGVILVGIARGEFVVDPYHMILFEKRLMGSMHGSCQMHRDAPLVLDLWRQGYIDVDSMITRHVTLENINDGFDALRSGLGLRTVVDF
jgi:S-(hydroxymethyl)glutathione dehydrogenase / alcohol dehydrogenase